MPYSEVPDFAKLRSKDAMAAAALEFTILTAARTSEIGTAAARVDSVVTKAKHGVCFFMSHQLSQ